MGLLARLAVAVAVVASIPALARAQGTSPPDEPEAPPLAVPPEGPPPPPAPLPPSQLPSVPSDPTPTEPPPAATGAGEPAELPRGSTVPPRFGAAGEVVVSAGSNVEITSTEFSDSDAKFVSVVVAPGFDYFIVDHVSIGAELAFGYGNAKGYSADSSLVETTTTSFAGGARFGVDVPLGETISFYPRLTLGVETVRRKTQILDGRIAPGALVGPSTTSLAGPYATIIAPLLFHPAPHFFIGAGPGLFHEFAEGSDPTLGGERTSIFGQVLVGGWWGGRTSEAVAPPPAAKRTHAERFGEQHQLVITGAVGAGVSRTSYPNGDERTNVGIAPGFDYFVARHVSLGALLNATYASGSGRQANGASYERDTTRMGGGIRLGVNVPLAASFSWYPRATLGVAIENDELRSGSSRNKSKDNVVDIGLFAPLLAHVADHFFVGFGPFVRHDIVRDPEIGAENLETNVGGDITFGGWL